MNKYALGVTGTGDMTRIRVLNLNGIAVGLTKADALNLIAWISIFGDISEAEIKQSIQEVKSNG